MSAITSSPAPPRQRLGLSLFVLAAAQLVIALDFNIVYVALPSIQEGLGFSEQDLQWVVSAYVVATGGFLLLGGRATDLLGRRRMFVLAAGLYAGSSLIGGLTDTAWLLVAVRAVQGIGGSLLFPATLSLITTIYEEGPRRNKALAVWGAAGAGGLCFGSLLGGVLVEAFGWPSVFMVNVPLAGAIAVAGWLLFPADPPRSRERDFDALGAVTATAGITLLVFLLVRGPEVGWTSKATVLCALCSALLLAAFAVIESRTRDPLTPVRLLTHRSLVAGMALAAVFNATFASVPYFLTRYFQLVHHYSALETGLAFLLPAVMVAAGTQVGERAVAAFGVRVTLLGGLLLGAAGAVALAVAFTDSGSYGRLVPGLVLLSLGQGAAWTALWIVAASGVAPSDQGIASGLASTTLQVGGAVGLALLVAVANPRSDGLTGDALRDGLVDGVRLVSYLIAAGICCGALVLLALRRTPSR
ncbi:MFS transporter [Streptomyces sp. AC536]|uniref:MFS transporter n=1 Tax=Streptomyces buecherae TaxID=2763006 RepID=UPI00164E4D3F|nr:MFS transporter [Streptomyces buecherae]MBC3984888.1 MFS transporter [Streptomyces buecherae]QNJ42843.1 MFS transporter [Streptomyces buecherae]